MIPTPPLQVWFLKCRAMVRKDYLDDLEMDEEGLGDLVMDDHAMATAPRPGTSLRNVGTSVGGSGPSPVIRPVSQSGRPLTGFARAGTSRATSSSGRNGSYATS